MQVEEVHGVEGGAESGHDRIRYIPGCGTVFIVEEARTLGRVPTGFDADGYRILCPPLLGESTEVLEL